MNAEPKFRIDDQVKFKIDRTETHGVITSIFVDKVVTKEGETIRISYAIMPDLTEKRYFNVYNVPLIRNENELEPYAPDSIVFPESTREEISQSINDLMVCGRNGGCEGCSARNAVCCNQVPAKAARIMEWFRSKCQM